MSIVKGLQQIPTPLAGLALGLASLGLNLDQRLALSGAMQWALGLVAAMLLLPVLLKYLSCPRQLPADLGHAVVGSVAPTFSMALMVISLSLGALSELAAQILWGAAVLLHLLLLAGFVRHQWPSLGWQRIAPSWFVPPVGIIVAAVTCPNDAMVPVASLLLYAGMAAYGVMLPLMLYRLMFHGPLPSAAAPTLAILAAPASLSLTGYLSLIEPVQPLVIALLLGIALLMTALVYLALIQLLRQPFTPGFAAFTFPLVIGASALYQCAGFFAQRQLDYAELLWTLADLELAIATLVIGYVCVCYARAYGGARLFRRLSRHVA
ncbi:TDT family transporter [Ferrimonas pelagia]|uniref:TDT family transporter n=1 Tax=Ferrimonas pelagia TaxID=1177826 RepID=A0ABP9ESX6_9GAMM